MDPFLHYLSLTGITFVLTMVPFLVVGTVFLVVRLDALYRRSRIDGLDRKRVFITGTDTGFGRELVVKLDRKGVTVYAGCYTRDGGRTLMADVSDRVRILYIDVTKRETLEMAREFIENDLPPDEGLWGVVNNAGCFRGLVFDLCVEQDFRDTMEVNFFGCVRTCETFAPLVKRARGRIVTVVSVLGRSSIGVEPYACSKHALEPYCDGLRRSMRTFGVHVAIVEPGFHRTNMTSEAAWQDELLRTWDRTSVETRHEYGEEFIDNAKRFLHLVNVHSPLKSLNKVHHVPDAIAHALTSKRPKDRYVCGLDAHLLMKTWNFTPDWLADIVIRFAMGYRHVAARLRS